MLASPDGRPRFEVLPGGRQGDAEPLAVRRLRFCSRLRAECRTHLNVELYEDRQVAGRLDDMPAGELVELVILLRQRAERHMAWLMQPRFGR